MDKRHFGNMIKKEITARLDANETLTHYQKRICELDQQIRDLGTKMEADYAFNPLFADLKQVKKELSENDFKIYFDRYQLFASKVSYEKMLRNGRREIIEEVLGKYSFSPKLEDSFDKIGEEGYSVVNFNVYGFISVQLPVKVVDGQVVNLEERERLEAAIAEGDDEREE